ncbi:hypothetical protein JCM14076_15190 [Methylosoma difficile]
MDLQTLKSQVNRSPAFIVDEDEIKRSLALLSDLRAQSGVKVLYSIKSLPLSNVLECAKPVVDGFSVSSLFEAKLAREILAGKGSIHLTTPGINFNELDDLLATVSHLSFNSLSQWQRFRQQKRKVVTSIGVRLNPKLSFIDDDRYNPCRPYSKLGISIDECWQNNLLENIQGLHIHSVFGYENYQPLIKTLEKMRSYFGKQLNQLQWINLGGGYLFNQISNHQPFIELVKQLKKDYGLDVYIEPGKAVVGDAGYLLTTVIDTFASDGKAIAVLDTSVNHQPEVFEYGFQPELHEHRDKGPYAVILAGGTCLAGDLFGEYRFNAPLKIGDKLVFKKVGAYSLVKASRFNGFNLPDIYAYEAGLLCQIKHYSYEDFRQQWLTDN